MVKSCSLFFSTLPSRLTILPSTTSSSRPAVTLSLFLSEPNPELKKMRMISLMKPSSITESTSFSRIMKSKVFDTAVEDSNDFQKDLLIVCWFSWLYTSLTAWDLLTKSILCEDLMRSNENNRTTAAGAAKKLSSVALESVPRPSKLFNVKRLFSKNTKRRT